MKLFPFCIGSLLLSGPVMAHSVEVGTGNWTNIPLLNAPPTVRLSDKAMSSIDALAANGKCKVVGDRRRINLDMDFIVQFTRNNEVKRVIVEQIGCPEVEQIVATATSQAADNGWLKPTGENDAGWYRGNVTYSLK